MYRRGDQHIVRRHNPFQRGVLAAVIVISSLWVAWSLYDLGRQRAGYDASSAEKEASMLQLRVEQLRAENRDLRQRIAFLEQGSAIDKQAYSQVEQDLNALQSEIAELKQQLSFYQNIVSPEDTAEGARVESLKITRGSEPGAFRYKLVLTQGPTRTNRATGSVSLIVVGVYDEDETEIEMRSLSGGKVSALKYDFKYYQNFEGDLLLPDGLDPTRVRIVFTPRGKGKAENRVFAWADVSS